MQQRTKQKMQQRTKQKMKPRTAPQPARGSRVEEEDPVYRIAYDVDHRKAGCVLIQAALGCDVPQNLFLEHFGSPDAWTLVARGCQIYPIRRSQLPLLVAKTDFDRGVDG